MTIVETQELLFNYFLENDKFILDKNLKDIFPIYDKEEDELKACILLALAAYEESGIVKKIKIKNVEYYILSKPLDSFTAQSVEISPQTALNIMKLINEFCDQSKDSENRCNVFKITDRDISNLAALYAKALEALVKQHEQVEE